MIAWLTPFGIGRSQFTILAMIGLVMTGLLLYSDFPKREDPEITIRTALVTAEFAGMTPERVEQLIADPVERKIRAIPEVEDIETLLSTGQMRVQVTLKDQVFDLEPIWQELRDKMEEVARELPDNTRGPFVNTDFGNVAIATIAVTGDGFSYREIEDTAEALQQHLYTVSGISKASIYGIQEERIWLELEEERLASIGSQINTLINDIQKQNIILPGGTLDADGTSILLETSGDFEQVIDIRNVLTRVESIDDFVRLNDLLSVRRGFVSPHEKPVYFNGKPALVVSVEMQSGQDIAQVGRDLKQAAQEFETRQPIGIDLSFATFQPEKVERSVNDAVTNVGQTFVVVLIVVLIFLTPRAGLVVSSIVPFAIMFALIGMNVLGIELEQVSIAAIIISLGLLVDNGVVIVEDILRRVQAGSRRSEAALAAGRQFAVPLLISSMTTVFAFMPLLLLEGSEGEYAFSLGAVVALTLLGSWIAAFYFLPFTAANVLKPHSQQKTQDPDNPSGFLKWLYDTYARLLAIALKSPHATIGACYALVGLAAFLFSMVPNQMFPLSDRNQILIFMDMPQGTHISATEASSLAVGRWLSDTDQNPEVQNHIVYVGDGGPRFYLSLNPNEPNPSSSFFLVNTDDLAGALALSRRAERYFVENHPEARFKIKQLSMGASESGIVEVEIKGPDLDRLLSLAEKVENAFAEAPGIVQNENDWGNKIIKAAIEINQDKARRLGITSEDMAQLLSAYFDGFQVSEYREDDKSIPVVLRATERSRDSVEDLLNIIVGGNNEIVSLEQVAVLVPQIEFSQIRRKNQERTIIVSAKSRDLTAGELLASIQDDLDALDLSGGYEVTIAGETATNSEINGKLGAGLPVALMLMLLAIVYQFNSFRRTLIVFMTIPLVVVGAPMGLLLTGEPMSFFGTLGLISLAGIIINNSIILIDQIDEELRSAPLKQAIETAARRRLRPILLTSATTILGLVPLYLFGGAMWSPLAVVMMAGLGAASLITVFFVPSAFMVLFERGDKKEQVATATA